MRRGDLSARTGPGPDHHPHQPPPSRGRLYRGKRSALLPPPLDGEGRGGVISPPARNLARPSPPPTSPIKGEAFRDLAPPLDGEGLGRGDLRRRVRWMKNHAPI